MKISFLIILIVLTSGITWAQNKIENCKKLVQTEQKICKNNVIAHIISEYVDYPKNALEQEKEGTIYVRFTTDNNQNLKSVRVLGDSNTELAAAAKEAIEKFVDSEGKMMLTQNEVYRIPVKFELE